MKGDAAIILLLLIGLIGAFVYLNNEDFGGLNSSQNDNVGNSDSNNENIIEELKGFCEKTGNKLINVVPIFPNSILCIQRKSEELNVDYYVVLNNNSFGEIYNFYKSNIPNNYHCNYVKFNENNYAISCVKKSNTEYDAISILILDYIYAREYVEESKENKLSSNYTYVLITEAKYRDIGKEPYISELRHPNAILYKKTNADYYFVPETTVNDVVNYYKTYSLTRNCNYNDIEDNLNLRNGKKIKCQNFEIEIFPAESITTAFLQLPIEGTKITIKKFENSEDDNQQDSSGDNTEEYYKPINKNPLVIEVEKYPGAILYDQKETEISEIDYYFIRDETPYNVYFFYTNHLPENYDCTDEQNQEIYTFECTYNADTITIEIKDAEHANGVECKVMKMHDTAATEYQ